MERFQTLRDSAYGITYSQTYLAQGTYAEALASTGAETELVNPATPGVSFVDATATMLPGSGRRLSRQGRGCAALAGTVTLFDADDDGDLDLVEVGASGLRLYRNDRGVLTEAPGVIGELRPAPARRADRGGRRGLRQRRPARPVPASSRAATGCCTSRRTAASRT